MIVQLFLLVSAGLAAEVNIAVNPSKCPELLNVPSDTSPVIFAGIVQDVTAPDDSGNYGAVLTVEQVLLGEDILQDHLMEDHSHDR